MAVKSLKSLLILFSKNCTFSCIHTDPLYRYRFPVFVPISCLGTVFLYSYRSPYRYYFPVLRYTIVISTMIITPACYYLTLVWFHLSPATWYITTWLVIIIFWESNLAFLYYIQWPVSLVL